MTRHFLLISILLVNLCSQVVQADENYEQAIANWSKVLVKYVDTAGRVDFSALAQNREALDDFVAYIASTSPKSAPELFPEQQDRLAYHLNAYNALAMQGVIEKGIPSGFTSFFKRAAFFKFRKITIGGKKTSLYDYENGVIRAFNEPRIHFALNCMVKDCPRLPREPFLANTLDEQLNSVTREFFNKEKHLRLDREKGIVYLSEILDFYTEDFVSSGRAQDLLSYVNNYLDIPAPDSYRVKFIKYDWRINSQAQ